MALTAWGLRKFLMRKPRPAVIRLTQGDKSEDMPVKPNQSFSRLGETINAVAPELVECFDTEGQLLRATRPHIDNDANEAPETPKVLSDDPETARITHFANLLARAYEHTTNVAFTKLLELVERLDQRSESIETRLERTETQYRRLMHANLQEAWERAEDALEDAQDAQAEASNGTGDIIEQMGRAFLGGKRDGERQQRRTNGKGGD